MAGAGFATLWSFSVDPARRAEFEAAYGPSGRWVELFRRAPGYVGTELLQDLAAPDRYLTIDRWESAEAFAEFRRRHGDEYRRLDSEFEGLTRREEPVGEFRPAAE